MPRKCLESPLARSSTFQGGVNRWTWEILQYQVRAASPSPMSFLFLDLFFGHRSLFLHRIRVCFYSVDFCLERRLHIFPVAKRARALPYVGNTLAMLFGRAIR